jgi:hypothetical protein
MDKPKDLFKEERFGDFIIIKRYTYDFENYIWEIPDTNFYLDKDKTCLLVLEPYTEDGYNEDYDLYEEEGHSSIHKIGATLDIKKLKKFIKGLPKR